MGKTSSEGKKEKMQYVTEVSDVMKPLTPEQQKLILFYINGLIAGSELKKDLKFTG